MKNIAILTCLKAAEVCSGASCFSAFNGRKGHFSVYEDEDVMLKAFFHCNGCSCEHNEDKKFLEKLQRVCSIGVDTVHAGVCTVTKEGECGTITEILSMLEDSGIQTVRGTH